ncbi:MAG TPA: TonB-dependent receptor [Flavisolibacter sp.]|nr:TonB-dependent receptor [Flavisolibacter sp.]
MSALYKLATILVFVCASLSAQSQTIAKGKIVDAVTKEPIQGATINCVEAECNCGCSTNAAGEFEMKCTDCYKLSVSYIGYSTQQITVNDQMILLLPSTTIMNEVVISANRGEAVKRSQAPIAITSLSTRLLQDTKAISVDQILNKVSGVNMVNLGNEQHQMSIRQPMTTKSLFLYLEDGIPVRTTGLFNHNALLEMNMTALKNIEVIKGPSSSLYGSEAIGGAVNFITLSPTSIPVLKLSAQAGSIGYKRADAQASFTKGKWGFAVSGYYADKRNGYIEYSNFHKGILTTRIDYRFNNNLSLANNITLLNYYSEMPGGIDSAMFASRRFFNANTFTYRKVDALRYRSTLTQIWNSNSKSTASLIYRYNTIGQNPQYRIKDDYRKVNGSFRGQKDLAHGEINESSFKSFAVNLQHKQKFLWKDAIVVGGVNSDISPSTYDATYIRIKKDSVTMKYVSYQPTDSLLTNYKARLNNYAAFTHIELSPLKKLRLVASLRLDLFNYDFNNHLTPSAFSGSADTVNHYSRFSSKFGFTYAISGKTGFYANYSEGFVPPQVSETYTGVKVPKLKPSVFYNYELGGWAELIKNKLSIDASIYQLNGTDEIITVRLDDGSSENRNAGKTAHRGIEFGINATPLKDVTIRFSGAYSKHRFEEFNEKGTDYSGYEMNNAPRWMHNSELWYKPSFVPGLRIGVEWQKIGNYYMDPKNTARYEGYNLFNIRAGYNLMEFEVWVNVINAGDSYYSNMAGKSNYGYSYQLAEPRNIILGLAYNFGGFLKK